jgi:F-type H+-transporting ATPase subunit b
MANVPTTDGSAAVATNLSDATSDQPLAPANIRDGSELKGEIHEAGGAEHQVEAVDPILGFNTTGWVGIAALIVLLLLLWKKVPALIGKQLDAKIAGIRRELDEAQRLRKEAEALKAEYEQKAAAAHQDAEGMRHQAEREAHDILVKAKADAEALMDRRAKMAEDKIAAAERAAIADVRARAAEAAAKAAALLIAEHAGADSDRARVDRTIAGLGRPH